MSRLRTTPLLLGSVLAASLAIVEAALGADWYTGAEPQRPNESWMVAVDTSTTVTSNSSAFGSVTVTGSPLGRMDESGVRVRVEGVAGTYSYPSENRSVRGYQQEGSALVGYELVWRDAALAGFVGLNVRANQLSISDPTNPVVGTELGVKAALNFFAKPTENTFVSAYGSYASTFNAYYTRVRGGVMVVDGVYIGPEVSFLGDDFFRQWRVGAHVSGLTFGSVTMSAAAGYAEDRVQKGGFYSTIEARTQF